MNKGKGQKDKQSIKHYTVNYRWSNRNPSGDRREGTQLLWKTKKFLKEKRTGL